MFKDVQTVDQKQEDKKSEADKATGPIVIIPEDKKSSDGDLLVKPVKIRTNPFFVYILVFLLLLAFVSLWSRPWLQELVDPKKYWSDQVRSTEEMIDIYRNELSLCRLETAKLWRNRRFEIAGHIRSGMTRIEAVDYFKNDLREQKDECLFQEELLQLEVSELEKAKANLAKYASER